MKAKYILIYREGGISEQREYALNQKEQAISEYKSLRNQANYIRLFSIDSEDETIWYDLGKKIN